MMKRTSAIVLFALPLLAGCDRGANATITQSRKVEIPSRPVKLDATSEERYSMSAHGGMEAPAENQPRSPLAWDLPTSWAPRPFKQPAIPGIKRIAMFGVGGSPDAVCSLDAMPGGDLEANVNRWRGQLGATALSPEEIDQLPRRPIIGIPAVFVEVAGAGPQAGSKLLGAICELPEATLFVKLTGPTATVDAEHANFDRFCASLRVGNMNTPPGPEPSSALAWDAPASWKKLDDRVGRVVGFSAGTSTECTVVVAGGGLGPNINRWRATQFGQPELNDAGIAALPKIKVFGQDAPLVELEGTYRDAQGKVHEGFALVGTIGNRDGQAVFIKMTGPTGEVRLERDRFLAFASSLR